GEFADQTDANALKGATGAFPIARYFFAASPGMARTSVRNLSPRTSKFGYWSNEAQAGESSTTGALRPEASASAAAAATARSSVSTISFSALPASVAAKAGAASPIR